MLYLGHFTYNGERSDEDVWEESAFGWFTLLVEAESAKEAIDRFGNLIESVDDRTDTFASAREVYIEEAIEVRELPEEGVLAYWHENFGVINASLSTSLPPAAPDGVAAFAWRSNELAEESEDEESVVPFYTWGDEEED